MRRSASLVLHFARSFRFLRLCLRAARGAGRCFGLLPLVTEQIYVLRQETRYDGGTSSATLSGSDDLVSPQRILIETNQIAFLAFLVEERGHYSPRFQVAIEPANFVFRRVLQIVLRSGMGHSWLCLGCCSLESASTKRVCVL